MMEESQRSVRFPPGPRVRRWPEAAPCLHSVPLRETGSRPVPGPVSRSLIQVQNVQRGSIWIRRGDSHVCSESIGPDAEKVKGLAVSARRPSIVGTVIETGR